MSYNHVPSIKNYWSNHNSLSNESIKSAISRDHFEQIMSKLYFAPVDKPADAGKTYYIDDFMNCLKTTFKACRDDDSFQSIDEQMTKFKGPSSLKQYMPLKPVKRGIKMWLRCDSLTGYTYDMSIYCGKEGSVLEGTLGERVGNDHAATISNPDVTLCFDRFFTTVNLINNIQYPALGTCMSNRKNVPKIPENLQRAEAIFKVNSAGTIAVKWQDVKEVMLLSNCHTSEMSTVRRKMKDGTEAEFSCPDIVKTYRAIMGGVDLQDQMSGLYDINRKSNKWWKKVFYRGMMMVAVNTWVIYSELNRKKPAFLPVLVEIAESLIEKGKESTAYKRSRRSGRSSNSTDPLVWTKWLDELSSEEEGSIDEADEDELEDNVVKSSDNQTDSKKNLFG
ncbi:piggyBac transposable element-derived protein 4-like [Anastrepha obliqua]|uniref:piggyBac transposable element-derived protein 4-like n=1 Tax=Anastrepha obliqua TaxID=95512 RepID=UPI002409A7D9|nr:piggyBac transposable element-derived protein 4-like [Anastrepha obliqua]